MINTQQKSVMGRRGTERSRRLTGQAGEKSRKTKLKKGESGALLPHRSSAGVLSGWGSSAYLFRDLTQSSQLFFSIVIGRVLAGAGGGGMGKEAQLELPPLLFSLSLSASQRFFFFFFLHKQTSQQFKGTECVCKKETFSNVCTGFYF